MGTASNRDSFRHCPLRAMASLVTIAALIFVPSAAAAQVYPVNGVFSAIDAEYPDRNGACMALKAFGIEAVSKQAVPELIIFSNDKRHAVKGETQSERKIKSVKKANGGFRISELVSGGPRLLGWRKKITYFLRVLDPVTIEIWDGKNLTQYAKCGPRRPPVS
jgi:hypothetical protein